MISNNLKAIRESKNMSQEYVAKTLHISRQSISRWENNRSVPDTENLVALSKLYGVSLDELIGDYATNEAALNDMHQEKNDTVKEDTIKMLLHATLLIVSTFISFIGIAVCLGFFIKLRKHNYPQIFYALCTICFLINVFNLFALLNGYFFHLGRITIQ